MHRILPNILFIVIIFILATALPLTTDILDLNLSQKIVDKPVEEIKIDPELSLILPETPDSMSNSFLTFDFESNTTVFPETFLDAYEIIILKNDTIIAKKGISEIKYELVDTSTNIKTVKIDKLSLMEGLDPAYYTFNLKSTEETFKYSWYASNLTYDKVLLKTTAQIPAKKIALTLFFPTFNYNDTVQVTRIVDVSKNRFRTLYTALYNGPRKGLGLYETAPVIPSSPNIKLSKNQANIYMYTKNLKDFEDRFPLATKAIAKTFMTFDSLEGVNFIVDNKQSGTVMGVDISKTFTDSIQNSGYIGYSHGTTNLFLMPIPLKSVTLDEKINEAWQLLKLNSETELFSADMIPTIPTEVELINYKVQGNIIELNVSKSAATLLKAYPEYELLFVKSLLYTFTSFPEIDTLQLKVDGNPWISSGFDFTTPLKPDPYFNLEP